MTASSGLPMSSSIAVERLGLRHRAREAVEHEAVLVREALPDEADHEVVGHQIAALEDRAARAPELRPVGDGFAQDVAGRDVRDVVGSGDALRLRALAGPLRAEDEDAHGVPAGYLRKPS